MPRGTKYKVLEVCVNCVSSVWSLRLLNHSRRRPPNLTIVSGLTFLFEIETASGSVKVVRRFAYNPWKTNAEKLRPRGPETKVTFGEAAQPQQPRYSTSRIAKGGHRVDSGLGILLRANKARLPHCV